MSVDNTLQINVYNADNALIPDHSNEFAKAAAVSFDTFWPGGRFGSASIFVPRDVLRWWAVKGANRLVIRHSIDPVWEGEIDGLADQVDESSEGELITCTGKWGAKLMRRRLRRWYVDSRTENGVWQNKETPGTVARCRVERRTDAGDVLALIPTTVAWTANDYYEITYTCPTGEYINKVTFDYDLTSYNNEDWDADLWDVGADAKLQDIAARTTTGTSTGSFTYTAGGATVSTIAIRLIAAPNGQTPVGTSHLEIANLKVHAWTGNTGNLADNLDEIAKDLVAKFSTVFNSDTGNIDTPASPFAITQLVPDWETIADILAGITGYGDGATPPNVWVAYLLASEKAASADGKPVLVVEQEPALTSYDVGVRLSGPNVVGGVSINKDYSRIVNWVIVTYRTADGRVEFVTPDDELALKDDTSIDAYGQRDSEPLSFGDADRTTAIQLGKRHLARWKDPQYVLDGPIVVQNYIEGPSGQPVPACRVYAGMRLRILDYIEDLNNGAGLTMHITATSYSAEDETVSITTGALDELAPWLAQVRDYEEPGVFEPHEDKKKKKRKKKKPKR